MMVRNFLRIVQLIAALVVAAATFADATNENLRTGTRSQITAFLDNYARDSAKRLGAGARVEFDSGSITGNAETRSCPAPLTISAHNQQSPGRVTLLVACGNDWSMYVPVDLNIYRPVVVATKPLASGAVIAAGDVELTALEIGQLTGSYLTALDDVIGMGVKRPVTPGRAILVQQLEQPLLIKRGEAVVINAERGELAVKMPGTALTDGRRGELIRIKNQTSARVVDARVIAPGHVTVPM